MKEGNNERMKDRSKERMKEVKEEGMKEQLHLSSSHVGTPVGQCILLSPLVRCPLWHYIIVSMMMNIRESCRALHHGESTGKALYHSLSHSSSLEGTLLCHLLWDYCTWHLTVYYFERFLDT